MMGKKLYFIFIIQVKTHQELRDILIFLEWAIKLFFRYLIMCSALKQKSEFLSVIIRLMYIIKIEKRLNFKCLICLNYCIYCVFTL